MVGSIVGVFDSCGKKFKWTCYCFDPWIVTVLLDIIHLLAASIWAGGLLYILVYWKKQREHVQQFLSLFSKVALVSILVLIVTGVASTFIFLPQVALSALYTMGNTAAYKSRSRFIGNRNCWYFTICNEKEARRFYREIAEDRLYSDDHYFRNCRCLYSLKSTSTK